MVDALVSNTSEETRAGSTPALGIFLSKLLVVDAEKIKIAIQKSGRLFEESISLIKSCGIKVIQSPRVLKATSANFPIEILFVRDDDIPYYVEKNIATLGIVGQNLLAEHNTNVCIEKKLGFSKCKLAIAINKNESYTGINWLQGKKIATSYTKILNNFLNKKKLKASVHYLSGSVEIAPNIELADAICDIVSTGSTLISNGLKEVETVFESEAVLIKTKEKLLESHQNIIEEFLFRIKAVKEAENKKYILMNVPTKNIDVITELLPSTTSPTILPLKDKDWVAIHSVITDTMFWQLIEKFKKLGAKGIITTSIEKMVL